MTLPDKTAPDFKSNEQAPTGSRGAVWRVVAISLLVLIVGLGAMWVYFFLKEQGGVGLESRPDHMPDEPAPQAAGDRVRLLFTADGVQLSPEMQEIRPTKSVYDHTSAVLQSLLRGPRSSKLRSPIPPGVKLRAVFIREDVAILDFTGDLRESLHGGPGAELLCVYSIANSLILNSRQIKRVAFLIEGRPVETLLGYLDLSGPLVANLALNAGEASRE